MLRGGKGGPAEEDNALTSSWPSAMQCIMLWIESLPPLTSPTTFIVDDESPPDESSRSQVVDNRRMSRKITVFVKLPFGLWMALWAGRFSPVSGPMGLI